MNDGNHHDALKYNRGFRRLLAGRIITNAGDSLYAVAAVWLVYDLTSSTIYTGIASFLVFLPRGLQFLAGPLIDRWSLRRLLVGTQIIQAVVVLIVPIASHFGYLSVTLILVVFPILSLINRFVYPAQYTALPRIVPESQLTRANSAFTFAEEGTSMAFNALGGILIGLIGAVSLYVVDSVTFAAAMLLFAGVQIPPAGDSTESDTQSDIADYISDLSEGVRFIQGSVWPKLILVGAIGNFNIGIAMATLPAFGAVRGGPAIYGALTAALGAGLALGALGASQVEHMSFGRVWMLGYGLAFILWLGSVYSPWVPSMVVLFMLAWIPSGITNVLENSLLQTVVPDELIGRVMAVSSSASWIALPIGSLIGGPISSALGSVTTMALASSGFGFISLYFATQPRLRRLPAINELEPEEPIIFSASSSSESND